MELKIAPNAGGVPYLKERVELKIAPNEGGVHYSYCTSS